MSILVLFRKILCNQWRAYSPLQGSANLTVKGVLPTAYLILLKKQKQILKNRYGFSNNIMQNLL